MRHKLVLVIGVLCLLGPALAEATVVLPLDFRQLASNASVIVRGRVVALTPQWAERHGIETVVTLEVTGYLKGNYGPQVIFRVPGGTIGRFRAVTAGAPAFRQGEEVIVFLSAIGPAIPTIVGFNQGVYRVTVDRASGAQVVTPPIIAADVTAPTRLVRGDPSRKPMRVAQFEAKVRSMLGPGAAPPIGRRPHDNGIWLQK